MTKWRKATIAILLGVTTFLIGYDILVVTNSEYDTISNVMMKTLYTFPFIIYAWCVLAGHFVSPIKTKRRYIGALVLLSVSVLIPSIVTAITHVLWPIWAILGLCVAGFLVGAITWSQVRKKRTNG